MNIPSAALACLLGLAMPCVPAAEVLTELISIDANGLDGSEDPPTTGITFSSDGRLAFFSAISTLVGDDTRSHPVLLRDRAGRTTTKAVGDSDFSNMLRQGLSADGNLVLFSTFDRTLFPDPPDNSPYLLRFDRTQRTITQVAILGPNDQPTTVADAGVFEGALSGDGRFAVFTTDAGDLTPDDPRAVPAVFLRDFQEQKTLRLFIHTPATSDQPFRDLAISADGRFIVFTDPLDDLPGDSNGKADVYLIDRSDGSKQVVSLGDGGQAGNGDSGDAIISRDGTTVAFASTATNMVAGDSNGASDVFVRELSTRRTTRVSVADAGAQADGPSIRPALSDDGRFVCFLSKATNLSAADPGGFQQVFRRDRREQRTVQVSLASAGGAPNQEASDCSISGDGAVVGFTSRATNLIPAPLAQPVQLYARDLSGASTNHPPLARAKDVTVDADPGEATATVTAQQVDDGSSDPDGDALAFRLVPPGPFEEGTTAVTLVVSDRALFATATATVTVRPVKPVAKCRDHLTVPTDPGQCTATVAAIDADAGSSDPKDRELAFRLEPAGPFALGDNRALLVVSNGVAEASCPLTITVVDREPPQVACSVDRPLLGAPPPRSHPLVDVGLHIAASDNCRVENLDISVTQNDPVFSLRPFDRTPDAVVLRDAGGAITGLQVRDESDPRRFGRIYLIRVTATDPSGNSATSACAVGVPSSNRAFDRLITSLLVQILPQLLGGTLRFDSLQVVGPG